MAEQVETQKNKSLLSCNAIKVVCVCPMFGLCSHTNKEDLGAGILNPLIKVWPPVAVDSLVNLSSAAAEGGGQVKEKCLAFQQPGASNCYCQTRLCIRS